jgi:hypothetical protein
VSNMNEMFKDAVSFDQNLGGWNVSRVFWMESMFSGATLSTENYNSLLNGWSEQTLKEYVVFSGGNSKYSSAGAAARAKIISDFSWTITDGGEE